MPGTTASAQDLLGDDYDAADYERVTDILDVWFDSGCTHAFVLESGALARPALARRPLPRRQRPASRLVPVLAARKLRHPRPRAVQGGADPRLHDGRQGHEDVQEHRQHDQSDQGDGDYGADIIRLWALSVDYTEDHRIGDEILKGVADQYRKLRNTFRYLLGALDGFERGRAGRRPRRCPSSSATCSRCSPQLDARAARRRSMTYDFNTYVRALSDFCNEDLSAFYFDIRKDSLYCDAPDDPKRRAYRTVLDTLFHALVRYAAPVLVFTAEEVWGTRYPDAGQRAFAGMAGGAAERFRSTDDWAALRALRTTVTEAIEPLRRDKVVRSSLEAEVTVPESTPIPALLAELFITSHSQRTAMPCR